MISAPSIIATDSIAASLNVGEDVPVLTSQAVAGGVQQGGNSLFTNTVSSRSSGVTLSIMARVNSSGIVTMVINQNVSSPQAPRGIQQHSIAVVPEPLLPDAAHRTGRRHRSHRRNHSGEQSAELGGRAVPAPAAGNRRACSARRAYTKSRTELVVFLTPRVIYDTNQIVDATDEIRNSMKRIPKLIKDQ